MAFDSDVSDMHPKIQRLAFQTKKLEIGRSAATSGQVDAVGRSCGLLWPLTGKLMKQQHISSQTERRLFLSPQNQGGKLVFASGKTLKNTAGPAGSSRCCLFLQSRSCTFAQFDSASI